MKSSIKPLLISLTLILTANQAVKAESLFHVNASENVYQTQPKSLFSTIKAKTIGDVITVVVNENATILNDLQMNVKGSSSMEDSFTSVIEDIFSSDRKDVRTALPNLDGFGGSSTTKNTASVSKTMKVQDTITTQVVQVLPNGNLVIQGRKLAINAGEKTQVIISGIVDPRFITNAGTIESQYVANLQVAVVGNGTISRHDNESLINRIFSHLF